MDATPEPTYGADGLDSTCIDTSRGETFQDDTFRVPRPAPNLTRDGGFSLDEP